MTETCMNQQELSDRWGIHTRTLEGWRTKGIGPAFLKLGGRVMYRLSDIQDYEQRCLRKSTAEVLA